jgi:lipopolysaccharide transport system ATP-binding protein
MSAYAILAEGIGKRYRIGVAAERRDSVRDLIAHALRAPARRWRELGGASAAGAPEDRATFWALQDVSLAVKQGEVLGIIGKNGAGKSTLLKVLSRITEPTTGRAELRGRVGSLLEVGTGFHADLSGRDNIFLNGSILGMDRGYIESKFDEIVDFAGVDRFIDTPVKRYSSGMYMRLAFAVAAHLEPEILIVDEVLAVGDQDFQKKCIGKMSEVAGHGRTVLFVSHNMGAVAKLCDRAIMLRDGRNVLEGSARDVVQAYLAAGGEQSAERHWSAAEAPGDEAVRLRRVAICQPTGQPTCRIDMLEPFEIEVEYEAYERCNEVNVGVQLWNDEGEQFFHGAHILGDESFTRLEPGRYVSVCRFPGGALNAGHYWISALTDVPYVKWVWQADRVLRFEVEQTSPQLARYKANNYRGVMGPHLGHWRRMRVPERAPFAAGEDALS